MKLRFHTFVNFVVVLRVFTFSNAILGFVDLPYAFLDFVNNIKFSVFEGK